MLHVLIWAVCLKNPFTVINQLCVLHNYLVTCPLCVTIPDGPPFTYPLQYRNYEEQQYEELQVLFDAMQNKSHPVLMGFFHHGPAYPGSLTWKHPIHYGLIHSRGFYSPYVLEDGRCTLCASNPTVNSIRHNKDMVVDHIYLPTTTFKRVLFSTVRMF